MTCEHCFAASTAEKANPEVISPSVGLVLFKRVVLIGLANFRVVGNSYRIGLFESCPSPARNVQKVRKH